MASIYTVWTTKGKAMAAEQLGPNNSITFTRVATSSKDYSSTDPTTLAALTKLDSEQQKGYIAYSNIINPSTLHMELLFKNSDATKNYNLCTVGLYATGSDKQEYLYSITVLRNPQVINTDSAGSTFGLSLNTIVGDAATVNVTITDAGAITQAILDAELANKVNVADMRKPASDVAGIEEVNAKQDTIAYTPADDSKVVHNSSDDAIRYGNNNIFNLSTKLSSQDDIFKITQEGLFQAINTAPANNPWGVGTPISGDCISLWWSCVFVDDNGEVYVETPNTKQWDRKVSENGTNNFHGKNTFDTAPIDKTTGNPYITKDGVPAVSSTLADTTKDANFTAKLQQNGQDVALANNTISRNPDTGSVSTANTFTAAQTFSIAPTITDASQDKGDNQAATMADLKSVENSAWHQLALPDTDALKSVKIIYQISGTNLNLVGMGITKEISTTPIDNWLSLSFLDFSPLVKSFKASDWVLATNTYDSSLATAYYNSGQEDSHIFGGITSNSGIITLERTSGNPVSQSLVGGNHVIFGGDSGFANLSVNEFK